MATDGCCYPTHCVNTRSWARRLCSSGQGKKFELWDEVIWSQRMETWLSEPGDGETPEALAELTL